MRYKEKDVFVKDTTEKTGTDSKPTLWDTILKQIVEIENLSEYSSAFKNKFAKLKKSFHDIKKVTTEKIDYLEYEVRTLQEDIDVIFAKKSALEIEKKDLKKKVRKLRGQESTEKENKFATFFLIIGGAAFVVDLFNIGKFILSKDILDFFSPKWFLGFSIVIIFGVAALLFVYLSKSGSAFENFIAINGFMFIILSLISYVFFGYKQIFLHLKPIDFIGYFVIFAFFVSIGIGYIHKIDFKRLRIPMCLYILSTVSVAIMMSYHYMFQNAKIELLSLLGGSLILVLGSFSSFLLHKLSFPKEETEETDGTEKENLEEFRAIQRIRSRIKNLKKEDIKRYLSFIVLLNLGVILGRIPLK